MLSGDIATNYCFNCSHDCNDDLLITVFNVHRISTLVVFVSFAVIDVEAALGGIEIELSELPSEFEEFCWGCINVFIVTLLPSCALRCFFPAACGMREETPTVDKSIIFWHMQHLALVCFVHFSIQLENLLSSIHWSLKCLLDISSKLV